MEKSTLQVHAIGMPQLDLFEMTLASDVSVKAQRVPIVHLFKVQIRFQLKAFQLLRFLLTDVYI